MEDLQLLQTLNALLCHDLAGSIGIIDNCLSLIETKNPSIRQKAKVLVVEESNNLVKKIKFFRSVYGLSDGEKQMSAIYLTKLLKDFFSIPKLELKLYFEDGIIYLDSFIAKAAICLAVIASEHISSNGKVDLFFGNDKSNNFIKIIASGDDLRLREDSFMVLNGANLPINVANCRENYINILCNKSGYKLSISKEDNILEYNLLKS